MFTGLPKQVFFKILKLSANGLNMNRQCIRYALVCTENSPKCLSSLIKSSLPTDFQNTKEYNVVAHANDTKVQLLFTMYLLLEEDTKLGP